MAEPVSDGRDRAITIIAASLLSLATITAAWCGYQSARWSGVETVRFNEAAAARAAQNLAENEAWLRRSIHVGLFVQYLVAMNDQKTKLADFLYSHFPEELKTATGAWIATHPLQNPDAPDSPFEMPQYKLSQAEEAREQRRIAERKTAEAKAANAASDQYVLMTVIVASVLFLGGISGKFKLYMVDMAMLAFGAAVLLAIWILLLRLPVY